MKQSNYVTCIQEVLKVIDPLHSPKFPYSITVQVLSTSSSTVAVFQWGYMYLVSEKLQYKTFYINGKHLRRLSKPQDQKECVCHCQWDFGICNNCVTFDFNSILFSCKEFLISSCLFLHYHDTHRQNCYTV